MSPPVIKTETVLINKKNYTIYTNTITGVRRVLPPPPADIADLFDFSVTPKEATSEAAVSQLQQLPPQSHHWSQLSFEDNLVPVTSSTAANSVPTVFDVARPSTSGRWPLEERRDVGGVGGVEGMLSYHKAPEEHMREYCLKKRLMIEQLETNASPSFIKSCIRSGLPRSGPIDYHAQLALAVGDPCVSVHQFEDKCDRLYAKEMSYYRPSAIHCTICKSHDHSTEEHLYSDQQSLSSAPRNASRLSHNHSTKDQTHVFSEQWSSSSTSRSASQVSLNQTTEDRLYSKQLSGSSRSSSRLSPSGHSQISSTQPVEMTTNYSDLQGGRKVNQSDPRLMSQTHRNIATEDNEETNFKKMDDRDYRYTDCNVVRSVNLFEERRRDVLHRHEKFDHLSPTGGKNQFDPPSSGRDIKTRPRGRSSVERADTYSSNHSSVPEFFDPEFFKKLSKRRSNAEKYDESTTREEAATTITADSTSTPSSRHSAKRESYQGRSGIAPDHGDSSDDSYVTERRAPPKRYLDLSPESRSRVKRLRDPRDASPWERCERIQVTLNLTDIFEPAQFRSWVIHHLPFWSHGGGSWTMLFHKMAQFPNVMLFTGQKIWPPSRDEIMDQLKIHKSLMIVMPKRSSIESLAGVAIPTAVQNYLNRSIKSGIGVTAIRRRWEAMSKRYSARGAELSTGESMTRLSTMVSLLLPNYVRIDLSEDAEGEKCLNFTSFVVKYFVDDPDLECKQDMVKVITSSWTEYQGVIHDLFAYQDRNDYPVATSLLNWMNARSDRAVRGLCDPKVDTLSAAIRKSIFQKLAGPS